MPAILNDPLNKDQALKMLKNKTIKRCYESKYSNTQN